jgi:hypothetical protein
MAWWNFFFCMQMVSLVSVIFLSGCVQPPVPVTGDIVIGRGFRPSPELYKKELQWEKEHPEHRDSSFIQQALGYGIPRQAIQDGRVVAVSCSNMGNFGEAWDRYLLLLPKGFRTGESPIVVFEAVTSPWNRATQSYSHRVSRFIKISDLGYHDVPEGCLWYHNGQLVEGYDGSYGWAEDKEGRKKLPKSLEDFLRN